jgi:hypothetical protein
MINKKTKLIEEANKRLLAEEYGGKEFELPSNHSAGLKVPKGGSCCANCKFWNSEKSLCGNKYYVKWNGDGTIPVPADEFCSDWWEPKK